MPSEQLHEGASEYLYRDLIYDSSFWSDTTVLGLPVPSTVFTDLFFSIKSTDNSTTLLTLKLSTSDIEWLDAPNGKCRINFNANTLTLSGTDYTYEFRAKLTTGAYIHIESGTLDILPSQTGNP